MTIKSTFAASFLFWILCSAAPAYAQEAGRDLSTVDSTRILLTTLEEKRADKERMDRMLEALNTVDSVYKMNYPTWIVLDEDLRERIYKAFLLRHYDVSRSEDIQIVANPDANEILEISVGAARMGRRDTYVTLSDSLHNEILTGDYARRAVNPLPERPRMGLSFGAQPRFASVYASAFGAGILFSNRWGLETRMGFEEIGYHFWSTGGLRAMAIFDQFKIGVMVPFTFGAIASAEPEPLDVRARRLSGAKGFTAEFDVPFESEVIGAHLSVGDLTRVTNYNLLTDSSGSYYLHTVSQIRYSRQETLGGGSHILILTGGLGFHQVGFGEVQHDGTIRTTEKQDFLGPILRVEYRHQGSNMFGASVQYYSSIMYIKGWVEHIKNFLYVDMQYYSPFLRDPKPWEQPYFLMVSPRIQVIY